MPGLIVLVGAVLVYRTGGVWSGWLTVAAVAGVAAILASVFARRGDIRRGLGRRSTRFGANSLTSIVLLLAVLVLVNYLGVRNDVRWDLTSEKLFTLSDQTALVLDGLEEEVQIRAFYSGEDPSVASLLDLYEAGSPRLSYEFVDPDAEPQLASQYEVTVYGMSSNPLTGENFSFGTLILEMAGRRERIEAEADPVGEQEVTNALMKLVRGETKTVYFVEGHGEKGPNDTEGRGLDTARRALERAGYVVASVNLVREAGVPQDASVVVWAGPAVEPFPEEVDLVDAYLSGGGSAFIMVDPPPDGASLEDLLDRWSVRAGDNFVVDVSGIGRLLGAGPEVPVVSDYSPTHPITGNFSLMTFFPMVRSITGVPDPEADPPINVTQLVTSGARSWGESDLGSPEVGFSADTDLEGPVSIGVAITRQFDESRTARLVVLGDSDFAANGFFDLQGNGDLFMNAISWLAEDEGFISIRPREPEDRPLVLTEAQARASYYLSMFLFPGAILLGGIVLWARRRPL